MQYQKGKSGNRAGRPPGSPNKVSAALREMISGFVQEKFDKIRSDFDQLKPVERAKIYTELLGYALPRLSSTSIGMEFDRMTDEQLDHIIEQLKRTSHEQEG